MKDDPHYQILGAYVIVTAPDGTEIRYARGATVPASKLYTAPRYLAMLVAEGMIGLVASAPPADPAPAPEGA
jgi:hypothetical protein